MNFHQTRVIIRWLGAVVAAASLLLFEVGVASGGEGYTCSYDGESVCLTDDYINNGWYCKAGACATCTPAEELDLCGAYGHQIMGYEWDEGGGT